MTQASMWKPISVIVFGLCEVSSPKLVAHPSVRVPRALGCRLTGAAAILEVASPGQAVGDRATDGKCHSALSYKPLEPREGEPRRPNKAYSRDY